MFRNCYWLIDILCLIFRLDTENTNVFLFYFLYIDFHILCIFICSIQKYAHVDVTRKQQPEYIFRAFGMKVVLWFILSVFKHEQQQQICKVYVATRACSLLFKHSCIQLLSSCTTCSTSAPPLKSSSLIKQYRIIQSSYSHIEKTVQWNHFQFQNITSSPLETNCKDIS
jgi:hypothetical protein